MSEVCDDDAQDALAPGDLVMNFCSHISKAREGGGSATVADGQGVASVFGVSALSG
jgi:hypothetical protein